MKVSAHLSAEEIRALFDAISHIQEQFAEVGRNTGDGILAAQSSHMLEEFKNPLRMAWESLEKDSTLLNDSGDKSDYLLFMLHPEEIIEELIAVLRKKSPFAAFEKDRGITQGLLRVYETLLGKKEH